MPSLPPLRVPEAAVDALVAAHTDLRIERDADPNAQPADGSVYAVAYAAARRLGFVAADAAVVASAWVRRAARVGFDPRDWPDDATGDFGLTRHPQPFAPCPSALGLYAVLPSADWVARMAAAGVPTLQLRFKHDDPARIHAEVSAAVRAVQGTSARLFINDHWRAALDAGAYGVHLGQEDLSTLTPEDIHTLRTSGLRLGISTHGYAEMVRAWQLGPSYLALGAIYPTTLKAMPTAPQGPGRLRMYARLAHGLPTVAIGGIGLEQLPEVASSGVGAFAVVRAIIGAGDPQAAARELMTAWARLRPQGQTPPNDPL
ncbi:Thiamine-phosphate synthase [Tepidimonas thermarum]|uniref:Thiamine-phosphate synthase n=1 Tax=Tepidimonas thermarum TaxID=335431 RepID=A0A554X8Z4_9BURK|nr:thiamine phosphate synthase [Tepidimonas thermarum]TSE32283.1 Thiamine-phosphate synthase [Tepidimonas thermarum]